MRITTPCLTRRQNTTARTDSTAYRTSSPTVRNVIVKSAKRGWSAQNDEVERGQVRQLGRLGSTPCVIANSITSDPTAMSKIDSTKNDDVTAG